LGVKRVIMGQTEDCQRHLVTLFTLAKLFSVDAEASRRFRFCGKRNQNVRGLNGWRECLLSVKSRHSRTGCIKLLLMLDPLAQHEPDYQLNPILRDERGACGNVGYGKG
jgi:hypothetical protein